MLVSSDLKADDGFVTSANGMRNKSLGNSGSRRNGFLPGLHRRRPEGSVRSCRDEVVKRRRGRDGPPKKSAAQSTRGNRPMKASSRPSTLLDAQREACAAFIASQRHEGGDGVADAL
jgi:hypothetical protein